MPARIAVTIAHAGGFADYGEFDGTAKTAALVAFGLSHDRLAMLASDRRASMRAAHK
jgi:hypothetical protein